MRESLVRKCQEIMLCLDTHDENGAMNAGERLAKLLDEITFAERYMALLIAAEGLLKLIDGVGYVEGHGYIDGEETDRVFPRYEFDDLRKAVESLRGIK